jgi:hypothetical protein
MRDGTRRAPRTGLWPKVDYYEMLQPPGEQSHPVDQALQRDPGIRRTYHRVRRLVSKVSVAEASKAAFRDLQDARVLQIEQEGRLAFNLGVELGLLVGRQDALRRVARPGRQEDTLVRTGRMMLEDPGSPAEDALLGLIELVWAVAAGPSAVGRIRRVHARSRSGPQL